MAYFDSNTSQYLGIFTALLVLISVIHNWWKTRNYPPGPYGLPIIGYIPFLGDYPNVTLRDLGKKYGDIFSFYIGPQMNICINDYHIAKELLNNPLVLARPPHSFDFLKGRGGFSGMNGDEWTEQRRFTLHKMRNLGLGKGLWESMIQEDATELVAKLKTSSGDPVPFTNPLSASQIQNSISLLFGRHLNPAQDGNYLEIIQKLRKLMMEHFSSVDVTINLPWLVKIVAYFNIAGFKNFITLLRSFEVIFEKEVEKRMNSKEETNRDDFIECYLEEMKKRNKEGGQHTFTALNLEGNLFMLFLAGQDSTIASVSWLLLLMAQHQDIQDKVCQEIDEVIGRDGTVYYEDKIKLPYTMAVVMEMMRWVSISPLFPPRYVMEEFTFKDYTIPKGAHIVTNSWAMMHNPKYFDDPMTYKPERFLDKDGGKVIKVEGYGPFSFGSRNCPGDGIATMTMYVYFVSLMQKFNVRTADGGPPDMSYKFSAGILPKDQKLRFIER